MERLLCQHKLMLRPRRAALRRIGVLIFFLATTASLFATKFTASLDRSTITMGESATLSLTFEGGQPNSAPSLPGIANLQIAYSGPSSQVTIVNGQVNSVMTYVYTLTPRQAGDYQIPAFTAEIGGQKLQTTPLSLKALKPNAPPPDAMTSGNQAAFMRLTLPKKEYYLGEIVVAELEIYHRQEMQPAEGPQLTSLPVEGFNAPRTVPGQRRAVRIGNTSYLLQTASIILTPTKTGPLRIGPVTAILSFAAPARNIQEQFFGGRRNQMNVATEEINLQCLPLPAENRPADFSGAVGNFTLDVKAGPTNVATGDPITVRVQISGRGAMEALTLPEQPDWKNFKTYPPTASMETTDGLGLQGRKTFEQIVTPESADIKELPAFTFTYFDPDAKKYRTLRQPPIPLTVRPGGTTVMPAIAAPRNQESDTAPPQQDIVPLKQRPGTVATISPPLLQRPWFLAMQAAPALLWVAALAWRKKTESLANNPRLRRQREVAKIVRDGLAELRAHAAANQSDDFFATLFRLLQEQLGERLDCPASAITEAVIEEKLRPRGVDDGMLTGLEELFQACNQARYAPIKSSQELAALIPKLETTLGELRGIAA